MVVCGISIPVCAVTTKTYYVERKLLIKTTNIVYITSPLNMRYNGGAGVS